MHYLASHAGRAVSRDELLARVWGLDPAGITTRTIDMHIARLREKLRDDKASPRIVLTVRGQGYMLAAGEASDETPGLGLARSSASASRLPPARWPGWAASRLPSNAPRPRHAGRRRSKKTCNWRSGEWTRRCQPLMAEESARPYFTYSPLYPAERAFTNMFAEIDRGDVLMPSPLLTFTSPQIRLHFQYGPDGRSSSPQVPAGNMRDLAENRYLSPELIEASLAPARRAGRTRQPQGARRRAARRRPDVAVGGTSHHAGGYGPISQSRSSNEYMMRSRNSKLAQSAAPAEAQPLWTRSTLSQGPLQAVWIGRDAAAGAAGACRGGHFLQGCWLDWDVIRADLMERAADLLPRRTAGTGARAERVEPNPDARLAAGAARSRARPPDEPDPLWSPVRLSLLIAWACLALAALAVALVLQGALALSERRGTFVSAVTHELRTPLTTFRLYTEMLDEGMVTERGIPASRT